MSKEILTLNSQTVIGMVHCLPLPTTADLMEIISELLIVQFRMQLRLKKQG